MAVLNSVSLALGISSIACVTSANINGDVRVTRLSLQRPSACIIAVWLLLGPGISSTFTSLA